MEISLNNIDEVNFLLGNHEAKDFGFLDSEIREGNASCIGDGLVMCSLFAIHRGANVRVGHRVYDNGMCAEKYGNSPEEAGAICFKTFYSRFAEIEEKCTKIYDRAGEPVEVYDDKMSEDNPNSYQKYFESLMENDN